MLLATDGAPNCNPVGDPAALNAALTKETISCEFIVDWASIPDQYSNPPVDQGCNHVRVYGTPAVGDPIDVWFSANCVDPDAWHWKGDPSVATAPITDCTVIELCPGACQKIKDGAYKSVTAGFGCPSLDLFASDRRGSHGPGQVIEPFL
ncbi:MAG: hypothetical protein PHU25_15675 [Deltaproteobacteria bacterium]|nr:hypothetical protein [Deltaproteobacteria bacterium]